MSSHNNEQLIRRAYERLSARDKQIVDAWRGLGLSLTDAMLESRAISDHLERRRPQDDSTEWYRRIAMQDRDLKIRLVAEHESAHAVVARNLGLKVLEMSIDTTDWSGRTRFEATSSRMARAAVAAGPDMWLNHLRRNIWPAGDPNGIRKDTRVFVEATGGDPVNMAEARRWAIEILSDRRDEVLALAHHLGEAGHLEF